MKMACVLGWLCVGAILGSGCKDQASVTVPPGATGTAKPNAGPQYYLDHAQPKLPTVKLWLGTNELAAELAAKRPEINTGMMYRESLGENEAMLFIFGSPRRVAFYMRNTKVPLSAAYIAADGIILEIHDLKPGDETPNKA